MEGMGRGRNRRNGAEGGERIGKGEGGLDIDINFVHWPLSSYSYATDHDFIINITAQE